MHKGQHFTKQKKNLSKIRLFLMLTALAILMCGIISGTVAWLVSETDPVKNTFTYGDINIVLDETKVNLDGTSVDENQDEIADRTASGNKYQIIPGSSITKDPMVTVKAGSENAWLFVKLEKSANFDTFMDYTVILEDDPDTTDVVEGWTALEGADGVYYKSVDKSDKEQKFYVIAENTVTVKDSVTKGMLNALSMNEDGTAKDPAEYPTLTITAYAVQRDNIPTAAEAWSKIPNDE